MKSSEELTAEESLKIITDMIRKTKSSFHHNGFYFLFWGWVTVIGYLGSFIIGKFDLYHSPHLIWLITIPAFIVSMVYGARSGKKQGARSYTSHVFMWLWIAVSFSIIITVAFGPQINFMITPMILTFVAIPTFISGVLIKFKPLIYGGSGFWIFAALAFAFPPEYQNVFGGVAVILGYLVPGYMFKKTI
ncbi:MAG: hypothetical protein AAFN93_19000 [Bacteroidota bacterium]